MIIVFFMVFHISPLLSNMAAGCVIINLSPRNHRIFRDLKPLTPTIYALFFAINPAPTSADTSASACFPKPGASGRRLFGYFYIIEIIVFQYQGYFGRRVCAGGG